jgi:hypothetical protein
MTCGACLFARQLALNWLLALDRLGNCVLLGDPSETISQRLGRAENAGNRIAWAVCRVLNVINPDHCQWSLEPGPSIGKQLWNWNP